MAYLSLCPTAAQGELAPERLARQASTEHPAGKLDHVSASENEIVCNDNLMNQYSTKLRTSSAVSANLSQ
jgi:hypothetical protein